MKKHLLFAGFIALLAITGMACKKKKVTKDDTADIKGNYFSITQFGLDEWNTFAGEPFMIVKSIKVDDGKFDSSWTTSDTLNWTPIFKAFFEADISDRKYLGKYKFSQFDDNADGTHNFFYEATDEELLLQKLLLTIDQYTSKVKGIYMEKVHKTLFDDKVEKLYYAPLKTIQIQTNDKPLFGKKRYSVIQYDFIR